MSEHTPGPWMHVGEWEVMGPEGVAVASCNTFEDARLIAAAPEMELLLRQFVDAVDRHCIELNSLDVDVGDGKQPFPWHEAWLHEARAAIAKATGGK